MKLFLSAPLLFLASFAFAQQPPENYPVDSASVIHPGVPKGEVLHFTFENSRIFPGTWREYWVYVPQQYNPAKPACVFVDQDGIQFKAPVVFDNLINSKEMPVTIGIFITPGRVRAKNDTVALDRYNRSLEYDGLGDAYVRFILEEILPDVEKQKTSDGRRITLSKNANDRSIGGSSSGAVCAFTAAWERPGAFSRVFSSIGTYVNLRGGNDYPSLIRKYEPKPIRIFLQDGSNDLNIYAGGWFLANQEMESALTFAGYAVEHIWGEGAHNGNHATAIFPQAMRWLWKDYPAPVIASRGKNPFLNDILLPGESWELVGDGYGLVANLGNDIHGAIYYHDLKTNKVYNIDSAKKLTATTTFGRKKDTMASGIKMKALILDVFNTMGDKTTHHIAGNDLIEAPKYIAGYYATGADNTPDAGKLFLFDKNRKPKIVDKGLKNPYGLALTPDQTQLYVTESNSHWVWIYSIKPDGSLTNKQRYGWLHQPDTAENAHPTGIKCDRDGRVYVATNLGVQVLDQIGRVEAILPLPVTSDEPTSLCFGGKDFNMLYVSYKTKVFRRKLKVKGIDDSAGPIKPPKPSL